MRIKVALHPEGVDRNLGYSTLFLLPTASPSTRRAWIEMLRAWEMKATTLSPSTRRAWIEIERESGCY